ncbi:S8 family serine peptidase (plasmid) [Macrococcoides canis]|uniref:S8 family peptidase n=1 Tax=Macrococcoides canis TaxID=1855823 RepID=UPI001F1C9843|nr:S8 family serine peptidase [Macrococcus canis]UJS29010.1 S8 family serine peptidase [Macrococcus canis]
MKKLILLIFIINLFFFSSEKVDAATTDILVGSNEDLRKIEEQVKNIDKDASIKSIPEIKLIRVESSINNIEDFINQDNVNSIGKLNKTEVEDIKLKIDKNAIALNKENITWPHDMLINSNSKIKKGKGVKIGIIDTGIDQTHPLFKNRINFNNSKNYTSNTNDLKDNNGHGTQVAGVILSIAPKSDLTIYKTLDTKDGDAFAIIKAIIDGTNNKEDILNISLGSYENTKSKEDEITIDAYQRAVNYASEHNTTIISSVGNENFNLDLKKKNEGIIHVPSNIPGVIGVTAINRNKIKSSFSNIGNEVDYSAPGGDIIFNDGKLDLNQLIYTTYPTYIDNNLESLNIKQGYILNAGTSLATPYISGLMSNIISNDKKNILSSKYYNSVLINNSIDLGNKGRDIEYGNGLPQF